MAAGQTRAPGFGWINIAILWLKQAAGSEPSQYIQDRLTDGRVFSLLAKGEHMARKIFVNLPVRDLRRSMDFFGKLGLIFNAQFTDESAACMIISEDIYVMLLTENKFAMQLSPRKFWCACHQRVGPKLTEWFTRRSPPGEKLTRNRKTTASCMVMDSRIWMGTFGSWPSWSRAQSSLRKVH